MPAPAPLDAPTLPGGRARILLFGSFALTVLLLAVTIAATRPGEPATEPGPVASGTPSTVAAGAYRIHAMHDRGCLAAGPAEPDGTAALVLADCAAATVTVKTVPGEDPARTRLEVAMGTDTGCVSGHDDTVTVVRDCEPAGLFGWDPQGAAYRLHLAGTGDCLAPNDTEVGLATCDPGSASQHFTLESLPAPAEVTPSGPGDAPVPEPVLDAGTYTLHTGVADLCLGTGPEPRNDSRTVVIVDDCDSAAPPFRLSPTDDGGYRLSVYFADEDFDACIASDPPGDDPNAYLLAPYRCADAELVDFALVPDGDGFRIVLADTGLCVAPLDGQVGRGQPVSSTACDAGAVTQVFTATS